MADWETLTLAQLASPDPHALATGPFGSAISAKYFVDEGVPVIRGSNLSLDVGVRLNDTGLAFLTPEKADEFDRSIARRGDLVFTCWGTLGQVGLVDQRSEFLEYVVSNKQMKMTPDPTRVDSLFLYYLLSAPQMVSQIQQQSLGAAVPGFNLGQLKALSVRVPDLQLQRQISAALGALDDLIENNRRRVAILEQMAREIYTEWFVRYRFPGHESATFVDSPLGSIPDTWMVKELSAVALVNAHSRKPLDDEVIRYLDISALSEREIGPLTSFVGMDAPGRARRVLHAGDTVWAMVRPNRRAHAYVSHPRLDWIASTGIAVITPASVSSDFLFEAASTQEFSDHLTSRATGAAYPAVKPSDFEDTELIIPDPSTEAAFTKAVGPMHEMVWQLREQSSSLAQIRDLLLPKLVTGQIDVSSL